jgi:hypothetical protein
MRYRVLALLLAVMSLALFSLISRLSAAPSAREEKQADEKSARSLHYWGKIVEIKKVGNDYHFKIEGRRVLLEGKDDARKEEGGRKLAHVIEVVDRGPPFMNPFLFCCVEGKSAVWLSPDKLGHCGDLKEGQYVLVWARGPCPDSK